MNICFVTRELSSIPGSGGIGTATENLAKALSKYGIKIDILFTTWLSDNDFLLHKNNFLKYDINLYTFDHFFTENIEPFEARVPQCVFNFFKKTEKLYDFIIFHEYMYDGYYVLNFNKSIDKLKNTKLWIITHSPMQWCFEANKTFIYDKKNILNFDLEKSCIENADLLTSPSEYMLQWINGRDYKIPNINKVIPNIIVDINEKIIEKSKIIKNNIKEIIFFGRLEDRKGLSIFISALNILPYEITKNYKITFLGRECHNNTEDTIIKKIKSTFKKITFKTNYTSKEAIAYLKKSHSLCIMPSFVENSPCTVLECLYYGIPFITSENGGQKELIEEKYREYSTFQPNYKSLCKKIIDILSQENIIIPAAQYTPKEIFGKYIELINNNNNNSSNNNIELYKNRISPLISIIITTYSRPKLLAQAITSALNQTYENTEIIVVDDGSTDDMTKNMCKTLERQHKIRYIQQKNKYLGAARNNGIKNAYGEYVVLLDDDNYLYTNFIEETYKVILNEKADCVTTGMQYFFDQDNPPNISDFTNKSFIFFGGRKKYKDPYISSLFYNIYGDATALYKKVVFDDIQFHEHYGVTHEDWALHQSLQIKGYKIVTIPEPLLFYRVSPNSMIRTTKKYDNFMAQLEPINLLNSSYYNNLGLLLQYINVERFNNKELPTIEDILNGKYDNCDDKLLLEFYKFIARTGIKLGKLFKNKKARYILTKIVQKKNI